MYISLTDFVLPPWEDVLMDEDWDQLEREREGLTEKDYEKRQAFFDDLFGLNYTD